jgi:DNA-binding SARP family transcriptional activator/tetratricopeptide (TPR) repeat protein
LQVVPGDSGEPGEFLAARLRALLAVLLWRANQPVPVDELAELVWDGAPPRGAAEATRALVMRLRRGLDKRAAARIVTRAPGYFIEVSGDELDASRFEALTWEAGAAVRAGRRAQAARAAAEALGLWRGMPLVDIPSQLLRDQWVPHLEQLQVQALDWRIEGDLHDGRHDQLIPELWDLTARHPLREHLHGQLMLALYRCGRQAEALAAYQRTRQVLAGELGVEPGPALRELHQRILSADPALAVAEPARSAAAEPQRVTPRELPSAVPGFTGRSAELRALTGLLDRSGTQGAEPIVITAIGGTAGVGKTALALQWAHQVAPKFVDGQLYVNLRGFGPSGTPVASGEAIRGFLDALGVAPDRVPASFDAQTGLYRLVAGKRVLIVLDNAGDVDQVRPLLPGSPGCLVLITSRTRLTGLTAREGAHLLSLDVLTEAEARQMLMLRLGGDRAAAEPGAVSEITSLCARLPLALAIAAARAADRPRFPLAELAAELRGAHSRLDALDAGDPAASVRAVFSWSIWQLSSAAARMFRLLGLHPGPDISAPAAASLADVPRAWARQCLGELTRAHLLTEHVPGRYAFHDLLRVYAAEQAQTTDSESDREAATSRMLGHYLHTAHTAALLLRPSRETISPAPPRRGVTPEQPIDHQQAVAWFEAERNVLLAVSAVAANAGFDVHAWQIPWAMADFLSWRGYWLEQVAIQRTAVAATTRLGDVAGQAESRRLLANSCARLADYDEARAHLAACLELYQQIGDRAGQARTHQSLSLTNERQGHLDAAIRHAGEALSLFRAIGHQAGQARSLNNIGYCLVQLGNYQQARSCCQQALSLWRKIGDRNDEATTLDSLGYAEHHLGHHAQAASCYSRALAIFRELGDQYYQAGTLTHLGDTHQSAGMLQQARGAWQQALDILDDLRHPDAGQVRAKLQELDPDGPFPLPQAGSLAVVGPAGAGLDARAERSVRRGGPTDGAPPGTRTAPGRPPDTG